MDPQTQKLTDSPLSQAPPQPQNPLPSKQPPHPLLISGLIFILGPVAYFLMVKYPKYHKWLAWLLILFGLSYGLLFGLQTFIIGPMFSSALQQMGSESQTTQTIDYVLLVFNVIQFIFGIYLLAKLRSNSKPPKIALILAALLLSANTIIVGIQTWNSFNSTLLPYYNSASQLSY